LKIHYFYSPTCSICETQKEILSELAKETNIPVSTSNIFVDLDKALLLGIKSAPAMAILMDGKSVEILNGFQSSKHISSRLDYWRDILT